MDIIKKHLALAYIKPLIPNNPIIVEAGAFDGTETRRMANLWPQATIHVFEPVPEIFERLVCNTSNLPHVQHYRYALSDSDGTAEFNCAQKPGKAENPCQAGSLLKPHERTAWSPIMYNRTITVPTITLDTWAAQNNIPAIDLLWLDVQGHALSVLKAAPTVLKTLKVLHVEVEFVQAYEGQATVDEVIAWLQEQGFVAIARNYATTTDWFFGDIIFVSKR